MKVGHRFVNRDGYVFEVVQIKKIEDKQGKHKFITFQYEWNGKVTDEEIKWSYFKEMKKYMRKVKNEKRSSKWSSSN